MADADVGHLVAGPGQHRYVLPHHRRGLHLVDGGHGLDADRAGVIPRDGVGTLQLLEVHQGRWPQKPLLHENQERGAAADRPDIVTGAKHAAGFSDGFWVEEIEVAHGGVELLANAKCHPSCIGGRRRRILQIKATCNRGIHSTAGKGLQRIRRHAGCRLRERHELERVEAVGTTRVAGMLLVVDMTAELAVYRHIHQFRRTATRRKTAIIAARSAVD